MNTDHNDLNYDKMNNKYNTNKKSFTFKLIQIIFAINIFKNL